jgi:glycine/D-amino acid oxidase-like deaminating enzyme
LTPGYRSLSLWHETCSESLEPRQPLEGDLAVDVAILGAGFTGLWTAIYLKQAKPELSIAVFEKEIAGFGASGRNGGWCSALFPWGPEQLERTYGHDAAVSTRRAMVETIDEIEEAIKRLEIECDFRREGTFTFARGNPQLERARAELDSVARFGVDQISELDSKAGPQASGSLLTVWDANCASLHPARLVRGLARAAERLGVRLFEQTEVLNYSSGRVVTNRGAVASSFIIDALEGYRSTLRQSRRDSIPIYSLMIATAPVADHTLDEIGLAPGATFADYRHLLIYGQRTADNRIAFGGRGAPYHFGSRVKPEFDYVPRIFEHLERELKLLFPQLAYTAITHRWGGALGIPRDWHAGVSLDLATGLGRAGGYVGDGVATSNLAGRTMRDLVLGHETELTRLPWVNHRSPRWEPEPLRFIGARGGVIAAGLADRIEASTGKATFISKILGSLTGKI